MQIYGFPVAQRRWSAVSFVYALNRGNLGPIDGEGLSKVQLAGL